MKAAEEPNHGYSLGRVYYIPFFYRAAVETDKKKRYWIIYLLERLSLPFWDIYSMIYALKRLFLPYWIFILWAVPAVLVWGCAMEFDQLAPSGLMTTRTSLQS
jgi:hypothetical protein